MSSDDDRCAEAERIHRIDDGFKRGDLAALRAALPDASSVPNGPMPAGIGSCLVYAIYHSPIAFIRALLDLGADPNAPVDDGFPPLIAALTTARSGTPGVTPRHDTVEIVRLLLTRGADPHQRGINDYTPLHMAVAERNMAAVLVLLDAGADPDLRTRIDECESPIEMARAGGLETIVAALERQQEPTRRRLRSGLTVLRDVPGEGDPVHRHHSYRIRLRLWLNRGEPVRWAAGSAIGAGGQIDDDGATLTTVVRIHRESLINGLFYGIDGMRVGGMRRLEIAPHLAFGSLGLPGLVPPGAVIVAEVTIVEANTEPQQPPSDRQA